MVCLRAKLEINLAFTYKYKDTYKDKYKDKDRRKLSSVVECGLPGIGGARGTTRLCCYATSKTKTNTNTKTNIGGKGTARLFCYANCAAA